MQIEIIVREKIARTVDKHAFAVCGNSDYTVKFDFDSEWNSYETKTARFKYNGSYTDVPFSGDKCPMPVIANAYRVEIGVYAGELHTSSPALLMLRKSILDGDEVESEASQEIKENLDKMLAGKIDAPQTAAVGEVLTVEEVDTDGKPKKWKTQTVETEPPDWNENDPTKPGYIKNRTHYDSRRTIELFNVTVENVTEDGFVKLADADIDISKITKLQLNNQYTGNDEVNTFTFESDTVEIRDIKGDGTRVLIIFKNGEKSISLVYGKTSKDIDGFTNTTGVYSPGLYIQVFQGDIKDTFIGYSEVGELKTINPKFIEDMYYSEYGERMLHGWDGYYASVNNKFSVPIPVVIIQGNRFEDIPCTNSNGIVTYYPDNYVITANFQNSTLTVQDSSNYTTISEEDVVFPVYQTVYHKIPENYIPDTIARANQIVKPNWNVVVESAPDAILNKPVIGLELIKARTSDSDLVTILPSFNIPSRISGAILEIRELTIVDYEDGDYIYFTDLSDSISGNLIQGNNLIIRMYIDPNYNNAVAIPIISKFGDDFVNPVIGIGKLLKFSKNVAFRLRCKGNKTIKCRDYGFYAV